MALADILANSVAMVIILIVITLLVKQDQETQRLEKIDEVSILLSRELATSVVMNKLPTSPPVRLHDYHTSLMDRNPQFHIMPIIELHKNYVRDYYHNTTIDLQELLLPNNRLDQYLSKLSDMQKLLMRVDIYDIRLFYIAMSIIKKHGFWPGHWHFMASSGTGKDGQTHDSKEEEKEHSPENKPSNDKKKDEKSEPDATDNQTIADTLGNNDEVMPMGLPEDINLHLSKSNSQQAYPYDDLAFAERGGQGDEYLDEQKPPSDLPGEMSRKADEQKTSDQMFSALSSLLTAMPAGDEAEPENNRLSRFRGARLMKEKSGEGQPAATQHHFEARVQFDELLLALFAFMKKAQIMADSGEVDVLANYNFKKDIAPYIGLLPPPNEPRLNEALHHLNEAVKEKIDYSAELIPVTFKQANSKKTDMKKDSTLLVAVNQRLQELQLRQAAWQQKPDGVPGKVHIGARLSLFPEIYKGVRIDIKKGGFVLLHPQQEHPDEYRWRVVTYVQNDLSDFITAFVYAAVEDGQLVLANEENGIYINQYVWINDHPIQAMRNELWLLIFYGLATLVITFSLLLRLRA